MAGQFFRVPPPRNGMGELPSTPMNENGALAINPPFGRPPTGNLAAPTGPGQSRILGDNQSSWQFITFQVGATPIKLQDLTYRKYFLIQNKSGAGTLFVGFGYAPNYSNGLVLAAGVGYDSYSYPINEIWVASDGPIVDGLMIYGV
jgi:hypothetical protein